MKKKFFNLLNAICIVGTTIAVAQNQYNVDVRNNMLHFTTARDYNHIIMDLNQDQKNLFIDFVQTNLHFNALANNPNSALCINIDDKLFGNMLNYNGYVQIGNYIYKVNPFNDYVNVIPSERTDLFEALNMDDLRDPAIRTYSPEDEVISMVETNTPPSNSRLFCGESGCGAGSLDKEVLLNNPNTNQACGSLHGWVMYRRYGIYFTLKAKCTNDCPTRRVYWHKTPVAYKIKCGSTTSPQYQYDIDSGANGNGSGWVWQQHFYQSMQPLNAFWLGIVFMAKDAAWIGNPDNPSVTLEIRKNM